jgi:N-methylhydantoinase A
MNIGVDTGGTFTDLVCQTEDGVLTWKLPSTPDDFSRAVLDGIHHFTDGTPFHRLIHSTTVATNALLERNGARTALITTRGFRDVLEIGRQARPDLYNLFVRRPAPLIERALRFEVTERIRHDGTIETPLDLEEVSQTLDAIEANGCTAVAVCLLFSFLVPAHEEMIAEADRARGLSVSISSTVSPEFREYERTATTAANAFVAPVMARYLGNLASRAGADALQIVQSNGGSLSAEAAAAHPVHTLLSGPAAGVIGAMSVARQAFSGEALRLITFDMGGTSTDVALIEDDIAFTTESEINGCPIRVPMIDIHTVGAGGGSIAHLDAGGAMQVGPRSAGAVPGPACYGTGREATVTDVNVVLRRIDPEAFLDGRRTLHAERSQTAVQAVDPDSPLESVAQSILSVVNSNMERAIRVISVERGYDPRTFTLVSFGGAGSLHACELATALRIPRVLVPRNPGVLSAWGCLASDFIQDFSRTVMLDEHSLDAAEPALQELTAAARHALDVEGFPEGSIFLTADCRYAGQSFELSVSWTPEPDTLRERFHHAHQLRYGTRMTDTPIELVTLRCRAVGKRSHPALMPLPASSTNPDPSRVLARESLPSGSTWQGPCIITEAYSTTWVPEAWAASVDAFGNQPVHQHCRRDGGNPATHRLLSEHQGATGFLLCGV